MDYTNILYHNFMNTVCENKLQFQINECCISFSVYFNFSLLFYTTYLSDKKEIDSNDIFK